MTGFDAVQETGNLIKMAVEDHPFGLIQDYIQNLHDQAFQQGQAKERKRCEKIARMYEPDERMPGVVYASDAIREWTG